MRVFDGRATIERANVVVRDGRIVAASPRTRIPADLRVIDGTGKTLLPGLIDSHAHVFPGAQADALRFGVTTEFDLFNAAPQFALWRTQRESLRRTLDADTWSAGIGVTVAGGHPNQWVPENMPRLSDAGAAAAFVDARLAEGSDFVKLILEDNGALDPGKPIPTLSRNSVCEIAAAARARRRLAIAHATRREHARDAVECGVDGLAHIFVDEIADDAFLEAARVRAVFVIPTLSVIAASSARPTGALIADRPDIAPLLSASQRRSLAAAFPVTHPEHIGCALQSVRRLHSAGIRILAGTDAPAPGSAHGTSLHQELALLVEAGLSPTQALEAATATPAQVLGLDDRGRILPGRRADLVLVNGDPARNIAHTLRIAGIWKNGFAVDRTPARH